MQLRESASISCRKEKKKYIRTKYSLTETEVNHGPDVFWYWPVFSLLVEPNYILFSHLAYMETDYSHSETFTSEIIAVLTKGEDTYSRVDLHFSFFWRIGNLFKTI